MISKSISTSTRLSEVSTFSCLLFTWIIPHCDDYGHLDANPKIVKAMVVPLRDETWEDVEKAIAELTKKNLIKKYEVEGRPYLEIVKWDEHQTFKNDRPLYQHSPLLEDEWNPLESKRNPKGNKRRLSEVKLSEVKLSEVKRSEVKDPRASMEYLKSPLKEDLKEFAERFSVTEKVIESKAEDLLLYCERSGRRYKNYKAFLLNALKRDLGGGDKAGGKYSGMKKTVATKS
jgi:hypothetical protein